MKTNYLVFFIITAFLLSSCSVGVNKDLLSGLKVSNSDLSYNESAVLLNNVKVTSPEFKIGDIIFIEVKGVEGYTEKNGLVNIGASVEVSDPSGKKIMDYPDLFEQYTENGISKVDAGVISLHIPVDSTMVVGTKYLWKSKIWDKNSKGMINTELEFTVK
jgi:hypothetical protein